MNKIVKETKHEYYCETYSSGEKYDSLDKLIKGWNDADLDYNVIFRFDIIKDKSSEDLLLNIVWIMQRKGRFWKTSCPVKDTQEDLDKIKAFLKPRQEYINKLWEL